MNLLEKASDFLVSTIGQSAVEAWNLSCDINTDLFQLRAALIKARRLIERSECWRLPKYDPIDRLSHQLKDAAYEAQSVVDEFEYYNLRNKVEKSFLGINFFKIWLNGFPTKVKRVLTRLDYVYDQMEKTCNSLEIPENPNQFSGAARPITSKFIDVCNMYGRDKELNEVIDLLGVCKSEPGSRKKAKSRNGSRLGIGNNCNSMDKKDDVSILSIVGMGGVGKTTLAQMVCNDRNVESYFDIIMWVCVSDNFDLVRLTKEIIESATNNHCSLSNLNALQVILHETLKSMKFLLVIDDVWSKDWQFLLEPMKGGEEGSVVMVTTRSLQCVELQGTNTHSRGVINLDGLENHDYWKFFKICAFGTKANSNNYPELELIGKEICDRLKGSPLAAKTVGSLLGMNLSVQHWSNIRDSDMWQLQQTEHDILPILQLSYQYLPSHLKMCFSFCSLYPKDYKFHITGLTKSWIMYGFIKPLDNLQQLETSAEGYFLDLVKRGFFQKDAQGGYQVYVIHDLMHDMGQSITKGECFCLENEDFEKASLDIRHVSVFQNNLTVTKQNELCHYTKLISLSVAYPNSCCLSTIKNWCDRLTNIRSLSLAKCQITELPDSIGNLKHLHYLDISCSTIEKLPETFCSLYNLQYLNMNDCFNVKSFPEGSNKMVNIKLFYLPVKMFSLIAHIENLAAAIQQENLQLLIGGPNDKIGNLKYMRKLRSSLIIQQLENVPSKEAAEEAQLNNKLSISRLDLSWSQTREHIVEPLLRGEHHDEEVLQGLCPHPYLKMLQISCYAGRNLSPSWLKEEFLPKLTEVHIEDCMNATTLSHLPRFITKLSIWRCNRLTNVKDCLDPSHLSVLKHLYISGCSELVSLPVESFGGFAFLELLKISYCPKLTCLNAMVLPTSIKKLKLGSCGDLENSIPDCLQNLTSLEELEVFQCPHLQSIPVQVTGDLQSLSYLSIEDCRELQSIAGLEFLGSLRDLYIQKCPSLVSLPSEVTRNLKSLSSLDVRDCAELQSLDGVQFIVSLQYLYIQMCPCLVSIPVEAFCNLKSLSYLNIKDCTELQSLGGLQFLASVQHLSIQRCPKLEETRGQDIYGKLPSELLADLPSPSYGRKRSAMRVRN